MIEYFKQQTPKQFTEGEIKQHQFLLKNKMNIKELSDRTKYLKSKVGKVRYEYVLQEGKKTNVYKVWEDELDKLQDYVFVKMLETRPLFGTTESQVV